jgi:hypothetical protein
MDLSGPSIDVKLKERKKERYPNIKNNWWIKIKMFEHIVW